MKPVVRFRRPRRKCAYCGRWIRKGEASTLLPNPGVYRNEPHFAHGNCQMKANDNISGGR